MIDLVYFTLLSVLALIVWFNIFEKYRKIRKAHDDLALHANRLKVELTYSNDSLESSKAEAYRLKVTLHEAMQKLAGIKTIIRGERPEFFPDEVLSRYENETFLDRS